MNIWEGLFRTSIKLTDPKINQGCQSSKALGTTDESDVFAELLRESLILQEGSYIGKVIGVADPSRTQATGRWYIKVKIQIKERHNVFVFFTAAGPAKRFLECFLPCILGTTVRVKIHHKGYNEQVYIQGEITEYLSHDLLQG